MSLVRIQDQFQQYVLQGDREQPAIAGLIDQRHGLPARARLAIYYDAYRIRLRDALAEAFDKTYAYVGDDVFADLCQNYIGAHPSHFRNLRWFGDQFPAFAAQSLAEYPIVAELAAFEWALGLAFDAEDAPVLSMAELQRLDAAAWESIGFVPHPSMQLLTLHWNAPAIWLALGREDGEAPPDAVQGEPLAWLVWRKELQPHFRSLDRFEASALAGLQAGRSFAEVCAEAADAAAGDEGVTARIATWLHTWVGESVLTSIR